MNTIVVTTQAELDALPMKFDTFTVIEIRSPATTKIQVRVNRGSSSVVAWDSSSVEARGSSSVVAWGSSSVVAWDSSRVARLGYGTVEETGMPEDETVSITLPKSKALALGLLTEGK